LTERIGFPPEDIIFDPNILTVATGPNGETNPLPFRGSKEPDHTFHTNHQ
jgi:hypothetical protein